MNAKPLLLRLKTIYGSGRNYVPHPKLKVSKVVSCVIAPLDIVDSRGCIARIFAVKQISKIKFEDGGSISSETFEPRSKLHCVF
jgi:hypothetical protein